MSLLDIYVFRFLDGICAVNQALSEDDANDIIWADNLRDHADGLLSGLEHYDKIHKEWDVIPEIYFRLRGECHFPIKYIEETIYGIMSDTNLYISDMGIEYAVFVLFLVCHYLCVSSYRY